MLRAFAFDGTGPRVVEDADEISDLIAQEGTVVWADLFAPTEEDLAWMHREFELKPSAFEDNRSAPRPKLKVYDDYAYIVVYAKTPDQLELSEIDIFVGNDWIITLHEKNTRGAHFDIEAVRERCDRGTVMRSVGFLLYTVLDEIVDAYFDAIEDIGDKIDAIESRIFEDMDPEADENPLQRQMLEVRKALLGFRRRVVPLREVLLMILRQEIPYVDPTAFHYFQDTLDHVLRITDEVDNRRELLGNAVDAHFAVVSNEMNLTMKKMTSWGAILIVSSIITGIFGMNFREMDFLDDRYGFRITLLVMVVLTLLLYRSFKRRHWL